MPKLKWHKVTAILVISLLCCLAFGGVASASSDPNELDPNVVKASHTYSYDFEFEIDDIDVSVLGKTNLVVQFPDQFDLSPADGTAVEIGVGVSRGSYHYMQIVPTINYTNNTATFYIQEENLPMDMGITVSYMVIEGLKVKNTCAPGTYTITVSNDRFGNEFFGLRVVETVGEIIITSPTDGTTASSGTTITVQGEVWNTCGEPWPYDSWPVLIDVVDSKGLPAIDPSTGELVCANVPESVRNDCHYQPDFCCTDPCTGDILCPWVAHTVRQGNVTTFTQTITVPACWKYGQDYFIRAQTIEVKDNHEDGDIDYVKAFTVDRDLVPAEGIEDGAFPHLEKGKYHRNDCFRTETHAWLAADEVNIVSGPGVAVAIKQIIPPNDFTVGDEIYFNKPIPIKVQVIDKFCHNTAVDSDLKVDLAAYYKVGWDGKDIAGRFYDEPGGTEISHVYVPAGESCVTVYFYANEYSVGKMIYIEERAIIGGNQIIAQCRAWVKNVYRVDLEVFPKVTVCPDPASPPRAGWPLKAAVWTDIRATEDYDVVVELYDAGEQTRCNFADWATWDTSLNVCFNKKGQYEGHGDVYDNDGDKLICDECHGWASYLHPYSTNKSHFYIYIDKSAVGKTLVAKVTLKGKTTGRILSSNEVTVGPFASPVELTRYLDADTWQTLSTPKYLANGSDCTKYGTFKDLLPAGSYDLITFYKNGKWTTVAGADADNLVVEPLTCYYIRTHQRKEPGPTADYWQAKYIYDRAENPSEMIPPVRTLGLGWNAVGVSVQYPCYNDGVTQADMVYHFLGSICNGCKLIYNPGPALGNKAPWQVLAVSEGTMPSWAYDPNYPAFNGDNYWVYLTQTQDLAANIGLDLVDP